MKHILTVIFLTLLTTSMALAESSPHRHNLVCEIEGGGTFSAHYNNSNINEDPLKVVLLKLPNEVQTRAYFNAFIFEHLWEGRIQIEFNDIDGTNFKTKVPFTFGSGGLETTSLLSTDNQEYSMNCIYNGSLRAQEKVKKYYSLYLEGIQEPNDKQIEKDLLQIARKKCDSGKATLEEDITIIKSPYSCSWVGCGYFLTVESKYRCFY